MKKKYLIILASVYISIYSMEIKEVTLPSCAKLESTFASKGWEQTEFTSSLISQLANKKLHPLVVSNAVNLALYQLKKSNDIKADALRLRKEDIMKVIFHDSPYVLDYLEQHNCLK